MKAISLIPAMLMVLLASCEKNSINRLSEIESFFKNARDSTTYFPIRDGLYDPYKVAVTFAFMNDFEFYNKTVMHNRKEYPADYYHYEA